MQYANFFKIRQRNATNPSIAFFILHILAHFEEMYKGIKKVAIVEIA